jgi:hypothetical protein
MILSSTISFFAGGPYFCSTLAWFNSAHPNKRVIKIKITNVISNTESIFLINHPPNGVKKMEFPPKGRREVGLKPYGLI